MSIKKSNEAVGVSRAEPRYIMMNEDIYDALTKDEMRVYMALRYEADYAKETSIVKRSIAFIVKKSKISRRQVFYCLNTLETTHYLIQRIEMPATGIQNNYNVSRTLNFFNQISTNASQVPITNTSAPDAPGDIICTENTATSAPYAPTSASDALLIINSFNNKSTTSEQSSPAAVSSKPLTPVELVEVYKQEFPDNPHPALSPVTKCYFRSLLDLIREFKKAWKADNGTELTEATFRGYLLFLQQQAPQFALGEYVHARSGVMMKNGLPTFLKVEHYVKFFNGEYS